MNPQPARRRIAPAAPDATPATACHSRFSTAGLPAAQRSEAWRDQVVPFLDIERPQHSAGFEAEAATLRFGPFLLYAARLPAYDYARGVQRIRRDSLDHWMIGFCRRGTQRQRSGDTVIDFRPGVPHVLSMARPFEARRTGGQVEWIALHVARDALPMLESRFEAALNQPLAGAPGALLADLLGGVADRLDSLAPGDLPHLAAAAEALLGASLRPDAANGGAAGIERLQFAHVRRLVRDNLGAATLRPGRLAAMAGMSRSQMYRLFEPHGGVAQFIQRVIIALGNEAALRALGRRRGHQRAGQQVDQRTVPGKRGQQALQQPGQVVAWRKMIVDAPRFAQPVAQLPQIARAAPPGDQPPQRPAQIGRGAQHGAQVAAQERFVLQPLHEV